MANWNRNLLATLLLPSLLLSGLSPFAAAQDANPAPGKTVVREIFVPFEDLNVLLDSQIQRIFLTRTEYKELLAKAKKSPTTEPAPQATVLLSANYQGVVEEGRARITGTLLLDVLADGLHAVPLILHGAGLRRVTVDGQAAPVGINEQRLPVLFVRDKGRKKIELEMVAPLETSAALQTLRIQLPALSSAPLQLSVPGNVDVKSGASVVRRAVEQAANVTKFDLLLPPGGKPLVMTLNNRQLMKQRALVARSVIVDEITQAYERLHATVSLGVLHGAIEQVQFALPDTFEVTSVHSTLLSRWAVEKIAANKTQRLTITLREPTTETIVVNLSAVRTPAVLDKWQLPQLEPLDVAGQAAVIGLLVEDRLKAESLTPGELIPIDTTILSQAFPESVFQAEPGAPQVRTIAAYFAPRNGYSLAANFASPPAKFEATTNLLLVIDEKQHQVRGTFALTPQAEKLFAIDFSVPPAWQVIEVSNIHGQPLSFETYSAEKGSRVRVRLPAGLAAGTTDNINFRATHVPDGWLADWKEAKATFPVFAALGAARDEGAIAVHSLDDLKVRPDQLDQLVPLDENEKGAYGLEGITTDLVYRYESQPYAATFHVQHALPEITARTFSFFRVATERLHAHYEVAFNVRNARTQSLTFALPAETPNVISVVGLDGVVVKEHNAVDASPEAKAAAENKSAAALRLWTATLADRRSGRIRLQIQFEQPLGQRSADAKKESDTKSAEAEVFKNIALPLLVAGEPFAANQQAGRHVQHQSGLVAVEGNSELDVQVTAADGTRRVDVGELAEADYQVGRHLLAAYGFVGVPPKVTIDVTRRPGYGLPSAIVQRAELVTLVSASGTQATAARYLLRSKSLLLETRLPIGAKLWSAQVDGKPVSPQRDGDSLLLSLTAAAGDAPRDLQLLYETHGSGLSLLSRVESVAPRLLLRTDQKAPAIEVPIADLRWSLSLPHGYRVVGNRGSVHPANDDYFTLSQLAPRNSAWGQLATVVEGRTRYSVDAQVSVISKTSESRARTEQYYFDALRDAPAGAALPSDGELRDGTKMAFDPATPPAAEAALSKTEPAPAVPQSVPVAKPNMPVPTAGEPMAPMPKVDKALRESKRLEEEMTKLKSELSERTAGRSYAAKDLPNANKFGEHGADTQHDADRAANIDFIEAGRASGSRKSLWALEGLRSLPFDFGSFLDSPTPLLVFESLGVEPNLQITVTHERRLTMLGWGLALLVFLAGLLRINRSAGSKVAFLVLVLAIVTIVPLLLPWEHAVGHVCDMVFWAAWWLVAVYLIVGCVRWCCRRCCGRFRGEPERLVNIGANGPATATLVFALSLMIGGGDAWAQKPVTVTENEIVIPIGERLKPVKVPADAVIVPYNPDDKDGLKNAEKILVPFDKYTELWKLANPTAPAADRPVAPFSLAGATYHATLKDDEFLTITGRIEVELFSDDAVDVPIALQGGVLAEAKVDGQPARLRVIQVAAPATAPNAEPPLPVQSMKKPAAQQQQTAAPPVEAPRELLAIVLSGKGRKQLDLVVRMHLERRGGWRIADGRIPHAAATALTLKALDAKTEIRLAGVADRPRFETSKANEEIETALIVGQQLNIQWRPKVAEGEVDRTLTARSQAELEVRDDAVRLAWQVTLDFPRSRRESFSLNVPADYLVERVIGGNIRAWSAAKDGQRQKIDVTLLKAVPDTESCVVFLSKRGRVGAGELAKFPLPVVNVTDAVLHQGVLAIRRSPLLDLRIHDIRGLVRTDAAAGSHVLENDPLEQSVLVSKPFQTFRFQSTNFAADLSAAELPATVTSRLQSVLRITDRDARQETLVNLSVANRPVHQVRLEIPAELEVDQVQLRAANGGNHDWSVTPAAAGRKLLTVQLTNGQLGDFGILVEGKLGRRKEADPVAVPQWKVLNAAQQDVDIVVQVDPSINVTADQLQGCESVLLGKELAATSGRYAWIAAAQRDVSRLAIRARSADYSGTLKLVRRQPRVSNFAVTNIRVTSRAIEETIGIDFQIEEAGVREVAFLLPAWMRGARVNARLLRQTIVEDVAAAADAKPNAEPLVRFRLEFQDEVMGLLQIVVQQDRLLTAQTQTVPVPVIETGRTDQRLVALESAGDSEVLFDKQEGVEPLTRQQKPWRKLAELFGENITAAFSVADGPQAARLTYRTKERALVETAAARIGLAETEFQVDESGAYRARVTYRVDNSTEQFLVVQLPDQAQLWTVRVAGEAVKPTEVPGGATGQVRIPLVKTAPGDADYQVSLVYAGKLPPLGTWQSVRIPFVKTVNINVELSLVKLLLPGSHHWFNFGGSLTQVGNEGDYKASFFEYTTKQVQQLTRLLQTNPDELTRFRCANNLKQLGTAVQSFASENSSLSGNTAFDSNFRFNNAAIEQAQKQLDEQTLANQADDVTMLDNRERLNERIVQQQASRAKNVVGKLGNNFDAYDAGRQASDSKPQQVEQQFNAKWFSSNKLAGPTSGKPAGGKTQDGKEAAGEVSGKKSRVNDSQIPAQQAQTPGRVANPGNAMKQPQSAVDALPQQRFVNPANESFRKQLQEIEAKGKSQQALQAAEPAKEAQQELGRRYQQRLELNSLNQDGANALPANSPVPQSNAAGLAGANQIQFGGMPGRPAAQGGMGGGQFQGGGGSGVDRATQPATKATNGTVRLDDFEQAQASAGGLPVVQGVGGGAHLASLDIELPRRGTEFFFKTPRGELEITSTAVDRSLTQRGTKLIWALCGLLLVGAISSGRKWWKKKSR